MIGNTVCELQCLGVSLVVTVLIPFSLQVVWWRQKSAARQLFQQAVLEALS